MSAVGATPRRTGAWATLVRGLGASPELRVGLGLTLALAVVATAGRVLVPVVLQLVVDRGLDAEGSGRRTVAVLAAVAFGALLATAVSGYLMDARLARATETALAALRVRAFRHLHDLSSLHLAAEQRGALVARVTADVDTISHFMQWGGVVLIVNVGQLILATVVMTVYSWRLTLVVLVAFGPLAFGLRWFQRRLARAYDRLRAKVAAMLGALGESVVAAEVIRAYGAERRTRERVDRTVDEQFRAGYRAARLGGFMFASGEVFASIAIAACVVVGVLLGVDGSLQQGELLAFLFLVTLFVGPVQISTEVLDQAQSAIAGWRRVLDLLDETPDIADPAARVAPPPRSLPAGPIGVHFERVSFAYPSRRTEARPASGGEGAPAPAVLHDIDVEVAPGSRIAVVGQTGSGKTTFAKLVTRLADPTTGRVLLGGVDARDVPFSSLRRRVVMVPQDGFLFDTSLGENIRYGRPERGSPADILAALRDLDLADWLEALPRGLDTPVGERGEQLSAGERQLVALVRAYLADPDLLVLDEATSAVDPATEARLQRAFEAMTRGRTSITVAHRLSTAEAADDVLVFDAGRIVQRGPHAVLAAHPGVYADLWASWIAGRAALVEAD